MELDKNKILHWIARQLPRGIVYWCAIVLWAEASAGDYSSEDATAITMSDALRRWDWK